MQVAFAFGFAEALELLLGESNQTLITMDIAKHREL